MLERRYRPGDVLDDYCPRERRITDHAVVAIVDDEIRRTRCVSCDAEHEYKEGRVPAPRRKTQPPALFAQVLEGLQGPAARLPSAAAPSAPEAAGPADQAPQGGPVAAGAAADVPPVPASLSPADTPPPQDNRDEGPVRRSLIRAQFPKMEGQPPTPRAMPEFTLQTLHNRGRHGGHGGPGGRPRHHRQHAGGADPFSGPMRFGRDNGHGGPTEGHRPHGQGQGQGQGRRRRRGGKKNR